MTTDATPTRPPQFVVAAEAQQKNQGREVPAFVQKRRHLKTPALTVAQNQPQQLMHQGQGFLP